VRLPVYTAVMRSGARLRRLLLALLLAMALGTPGSAIAQSSGSPAVGSLHPEWTVEATRAGRARVVGYLYNDDLRDAANVWLRVDQVSDDGTVRWMFRRRLAGDVLSRGRMAFDVAVASPTASYRVLVESVDWVMECR
jgi:hypothetical protein